MEKLRVVQWTTGKVGKMALRAILDDPRLELVGVFAHSAEKAGLDAGELCGRPPCGIAAIQDVDALIALGADTVIYAPFEADLAHLVALLESGSDVISTNLLANLGGIVGDVRDQLEAACARGRSSLYISGINPGWIDTLAAAVTPICRGIESVSVTECVKVAHYESVETWLAVGMSLAEATPEVVQSARGALTSFRDSVLRLAEALRFELDDIEFVVDYATSGETLDLGWFRMEKGTHVALRGSWEGKIHGRTVIRNRILWYMTDKIDQDWGIDRNNYRVDVAGEPDIELRIAVKTPSHWSNLEHAICTALPAVNAIFQIKAAAPGVLGLQGGGLPAAPAGVWRH
jgi:2,4-diaminopentanoate dehydrogenase